MSTAYEVLGVSFQATPQDIKRAYRDLSKKYALSSDQEQMYAINAAYEQLGKGREDQVSLEKRRHYDLSLKSDKNLEGSKAMPGLFQFGEPVQLTSSISIPEGDIGLLYALREAHRSPNVGKWIVRVSQDDPRYGLLGDNQLWEVRRGPDGRISVLRSLKDFKRPYNQIEVLKDGVWQVVDDSAMFGRTYWKDRSHVRNVDIPYDYERYVNTMISLASKISKDIDYGQTYDLNQEVMSLSALSRPTPMREAIVRIQLDRFWKTLQEFSIYVESNSKPMAVETKKTTSGEKHSTSHPSIESIPGSQVAVRVQTPRIHENPFKKPDSTPLLLPAELKG